MKISLLTFIFMACPFIGLHAADDNASGEQPVTTQAVDDITQENEIATDESGTESMTQSSAQESEIAETTDENFVPSIQITEDLPVAFPVDI